MKQAIGFLVLILVLFGCQKKQPDVIIKPIYIYRDTADAHFIKTIGQIESGNTDSITGENGAGVGRFGIYEVCLRGTGFDKLFGYTHSDMMNKEASERVFWAMMGIFVYQHMQKTGDAPTYEELSRKWAGGPNGELKAATLKYLIKFKSESK